MDEYIFTRDQLNKLLGEVIDLRDEYINVHGKSADSARVVAVYDTLDGLDEEKELIAEGEQFTPSQMIVEGYSARSLAVALAQVIRAGLRSGRYKAEEDSLVDLVERLEKIVEGDDSNSKS